MFCGEDYIRCQKCGTLVKNYKNTNKYCKTCGQYQPIETKTVICVDCGKEFSVDARITNKIRCDECQGEKKRKDTKLRVQKYRKS